MWNDKPLAEKNRLVAKYVLLFVTGMFGFAFAVVPLYGLLCSTLGIGPAFASPAKRGNTPTTESRYVTMHFVSQVNAGLAADFGPVSELTKRVKVGEMNTVSYRFRNLSNKPIEFQAVHSVAPEQAGPSLQKIECFCFTRQSMKPHEVRTMPVTFRLEPTVGKEIPEVTLAYTLYALEPDQKQIEHGQTKSLSTIK
ncbi:MAG: cytochrome c oxidase assembly protein [Candidatus Sericytochromatia bacterium]|nr:cytochrome c oxidase assembly protein [Candidatus Sericytochromatia bacterium]